MRRDSSEDSGTFSAADVAASATAVGRVWAMVLNKNTQDSTAVEPRLSLPTVELVADGNGQYRGVFTEVVSAGEHQIIGIVEKLRSAGLLDYIKIASRNPQAQKPGSGLGRDSAGMFQNLRNSFPNVIKNTFKSHPEYPLRVLLG